MILRLHQDFWVYNEAATEKKGRMQKTLYFPSLFVLLYKGWPKTSPTKLSPRQHTWLTAGLLALG
jgi:hypothetical protein